MTCVKICGLRPGDDLRFTADKVVTHIGFVLVPQSRRYVEPSAVGDMVRTVPSDTVKSVGVFVNASVSTVDAIMKTARLEVAQLHGNETPSDCRQLREQGRTVWKSICVPLQHADVNRLAERVLQYAEVVDAILLDAAPPKEAGSVSGGHGVAWDWSILKEMAAACEGASLPPLWVAGGIRPDNVQSLLSNFRPYGIDVSSGVERAGRKDPNKIIELIKAVSRSEQQSNVS
ncbi:phosphoribosylanthranilate isomerase [Alicyclobacillus pomorum]|jgi:phosphoribosylanthranilate isomerase|uniref:phosphoribosylanthranilate isomerase n=1 Tax=Alicyclobacillus pomorum TaxID=204470 RepID=UPI000425FF8D|nr:phosphoribosylanthranilate isomerase [Alicyclobacillus pomorum]